MVRLFGLGPVEPRHRKRRLRGRVGMRSRAFSSWKSGKWANYLAAPFAHRRGEVGVEIAEKRERPTTRPFLTHEQQWDLRGQQHDGDTGSQRRLLRARSEPSSERVVSDMVVILQKRDGKQSPAIRPMARRAALPSPKRGRRLALIEPNPSANAWPRWAPACLRNRRKSPISHQ